MYPVNRINNNPDIIKPIFFVLLNNNKTDIVNSKIIINMEVGNTKKLGIKTDLFKSFINES